MRVLIADDDLTSRMLLKAILKKKGYETVETVDGTQAWEKMQLGGAPEIVILDWMMPGKNGLELVSLIRGRNYKQRPYIIMLTSKNEKSDIVTALDCGADDYLLKPFDAEELWARIRVGKRMIELQKSLSDRITELTSALEHIKTLQGILPICSFCKNIRDDTGYWNDVDVYMTEHSDAEFSHSICPDCMKKHYPEFCKKADKKD